MQEVAGELLFRVLDRPKFRELLRNGARDDWSASFLDRGQWSLSEPAGHHYVVLDGPAFPLDAPWMYEEHDTFEELPLAEGDTATLVIPLQVLRRWRGTLRTLPIDGEVARNAPAERDALSRLMDTVIDSDDLDLTVTSLL